MLVLDQILTFRDSFGRDCFVVVVRDENWNLIQAISCRMITRDVLAIALSRNKKQHPFVSFLDRSVSDSSCIQCGIFNNIPSFVGR